MKKLFILLAAILSSAALVGAQEAFKHLGIGLEVGTAGAGVELSFPLVTDHLVIKGGYNFPSISVTGKYTLDTKSINNEIADANSALQEEGVPSSELIKTSFADSEPLSYVGKANFGAGKVMLEYYPFKKSSFHITAGLYIGSSDFITVSAQSSASFMTSFNSLSNEITILKDKYGTTIKELDNINPEDLLKYNIGKKTYQFSQKDGKACTQLAGNIAVARPYFGLGFGRSIPKTRCGFQFELGAWYHGKPSVSASNEVTYKSSISSLISQEELDTVAKFGFYPQITFRFTVRIF